MDAETAVSRALPVFSTARQNDWAGLRADIAQTGVPAALAADVAAFMPIAFGRELLNGMGIEFSPDYATHGAGTGVRIAGRLADHPVYAAAAALAAGLMERQEAGDEFVGVAVWSAEFSAANQALHAGSQLSDLVAAPPVILGDDEPASAPAPAPSPGEKSRPWWRVWG
ncbi:MAG TPA: hypothetical protein VEX86_05040 [Longimicrobium sp.]|nr:hypothetical protein [Longimicrobium sp.]